MRTKALLPLVLLAMFWHGSAFAQLHFGPELRGAYIKAFGGLHPGLGFSISDGAPKRLNWQADIGGYLPMKYSHSMLLGPEGLAAGDTNLRTVSFDRRSGLVSVAGGLQYALGSDLVKKGFCLELGLTLDQYLYRNEYSTRYERSGQMTNSVDKFGMTQLTLRVGVAHHIDLGPGRMRFALNVSPLSINVAGFAEPSLQTAPLVGATVGYQWTNAKRNRRSLSGE